MRMIEINIENAMYDCRAVGKTGVFKYGATTVTCLDRHRFLVALHDDDIVSFDNGKLEVRHCGHITALTRSRINLATELVKGVSTRIKAGKMYAGDTEIGAGWTEVK